MEYNIDMEKCERRNEIPRLMHHTILNHISGDPSIKSIESLFQGKMPTYPKKHKKTTEEIKRELYILESKRNAIEKARNELLKKNRENPEYLSSIAREICEKCPQTNGGENYEFLHETAV